MMNDDLPRKQRSIAATILTFSCPLEDPDFPREKREAMKLEYRSTD
jgi:hypothetical protein